MKRKVKLFGVIIFMILFNMVFTVQSQAASNSFSIEDDYDITYKYYKEGYGAGSGEMTLLSVKHDVSFLFPDYDYNIYPHAKAKGYTLTVLGEWNGTSRICSTGVQKITIPYTVKKIGSVAFHCCGVKTVALNDSNSCAVTYIGKHAFCNNQDLTTFPMEYFKKLKYIGEEAFYLTGLDIGNMQLPQSLTYIGKKAFGSASFTLPEANPNIDPFRETERWVQVGGSETYAPGCIVTNEYYALKKETVARLYTVTFRENNGSDVNDMEIEYDYSFPDDLNELPQPTPPLPEQVFVGWTEDLNADCNLSTPLESGYEPKGNITLFAMYAYPVEGITAVDWKYFDRNSRYADDLEWQLMYQITPANASNKSVIFESSNPSVATVDKNGVVTAKVTGTCTITLKTVEGGFTDTTKIYVEIICPSSVVISQESAELVIGENDTLDLGATIYPELAYNQKVSWESSAEDVATVNMDGVVTAVKAGTAQITVTTDEGGYTDICDVVVIQKAEEVDIVCSNSTLILGDGDLTNDTVQLSATVLPIDTSDKSVSWESLNQEIATVDGTGFVTAIANGDAVIEATAGTITNACSITVETAVSSIELNSITQTIEKGETYKLEATVNPEEASYPTVTWESNDTSIATVAQDGVVTAVSDGETTINAYAGGKSTTCAVTVRTSVQSIILSQTSQTINLGKKHILVATINPEDATYPTVTWTSSNVGIATVNQSGEVTAVGVGRATITAQADGISAQCTIINTIPVTGVALSSSYETVNKGRSFILTASVSPSNATNKGVFWQSSDSSVAIVDQNGIVNAIGKGTASITANVEGKKSSCTVEVVVYVESINIINSSIKLNKGDQYILSVNVSPNDATDDSIIWKSSDATVVSVSQNGLVTANSKGTAVITATSGDNSNTCYVTVEVPVIGITISNRALSIDTGDTFQLSATINPGDATNQSISWQSSDTDVVIVNGSGKVQAIGSGNAIVSASIDGKKATCVVTAFDSTKEDSALEVIAISSQEVALSALPKIEGKVITTNSAEVDDETGIITLEIDISNLPDNIGSIMLPDGRIISRSEAVNGMLRISIREDERNSDGEVELVLIDDSEVALGSVIISTTFDDGKTVWPFILAGFLGLLLVAGFVYKYWKNNKAS